MTREEAVGVIKDFVAYGEHVNAFVYKGSTSIPIDALNMAIEALQDKWIPVSERLPEEDEDVLVTVYFRGLKQKHKNGWNDHIKPCYYVDIAKHIGGEWGSMSDEYKVSPDRHVVIAWRPLPEPYKESEK